MEKILESEGITLIKSKDQYYLQYDAGELMVKMKNLAITSVEAQQVMENPESAYDVIIAYHNKRIYGDDVL